MPPVKATDEILIATAKHTIDVTLDNMLKAIDTWTHQLSDTNEPGSGGNYTARAYSIEADHPPPDAAMMVPHQENVIRSGIQTQTSQALW